MGPPVATISGEIESMVGTTPVPVIGMSIFATVPFENVNSRVAVSCTLIREGLNVIPKLQEISEASVNGPEDGVHAEPPLVGAAIAKSAEFADERMLTLVTASGGAPEPKLNTVTLISGSGVIPFGTDPNAIGLGETDAMGPFTSPSRKIDGSPSASSSLTVSVANRLPCSVPIGVKITPKKQDAPGATDVAVPVGAKAQMGDPLVGATTLKSPAFVLPLVAEPADRISAAPPGVPQTPGDVAITQFVSWTFITALVPPAFRAGKETKFGLKVISGVPFALITKLKVSAAVPPPGVGLKTVTGAPGDATGAVSTDPSTMTVSVLPLLEAVPKFSNPLMVNSVPFTNPVPVRVNVTGSATIPGLILEVTPVMSGIGFITVKGNVLAEAPNGSVRPMSSTVPSVRRVEGTLTVNCVVLTNVVVIPVGIKAN